MNLTEIEALAQAYAERYRELQGAVQALEDGMRTIKRKLLPTIRRLAEESAKDPLFTKVYDSMSAFQAENNDWHDYGYLPRNFK